MQSGDRRACILESPICCILLFDCCSSNARQILYHTVWHIACCKKLATAYACAIVRKYKRIRARIHTSSVHVRGISPPRTSSSSSASAAADTEACVNASNRIDKYTPVMCTCRTAALKLLSSNTRCNTPLTRLTSTEKALPVTGRKSRTNRYRAIWVTLHHGTPVHAPGRGRHSKLSKHVLHTGGRPRFPLERGFPAGPSAGVNVLVVVRER
jgi:hypothetical protein